jgi:hypothetical protein
VKLGTQTKIRFQVTGYAAQPPTITPAMFHDGLHGDGAANNGVWGAVIPAQNGDTTFNHRVVCNPLRVSSGIREPFHRSKRTRKLRNVCMFRFGLCLLPVFVSAAELTVGLGGFKTAGEGVAALAEEIIQAHNHDIIHPSARLAPLFAAAASPCGCWRTRPHRA